MHYFLKEAIIGMSKRSPLLFLMVEFFILAHPS